MLAGKKPLALFYDDADLPADPRIVPEHQFDAYVNSGQFSKGEVVLGIPDPELGTPVKIRYVFYAVQAEAWRIPAAVLLLKTRMGVNAMADEGLEKMLCALLGYSESETQACLEAHVLERC